MSVRSFHSVFMASAVAGAALGCYLVSLRVASERAALEQVEKQIVLAQRDIRLIETEIGTRARLAQLERWNVRVLSLSAPTADQILGDKFQLASLVAPQRKPAIEAPVILASAPAPQPQQPLASEPEADATAEPVGELLHVASLKAPERETAPPKVAPAPPKAAPAPAKAASAASKPVKAKAAETKAPGGDKKVGDKRAKDAAPAMTRSVRTANVDPLAPLPAEASTAKGSRTAR